MVDALAIVDANLVVQQVAVVGILQEVALELHAYVAAVARRGTVAVGGACQLGDVLRIGHESLVDGVHWVLKCERALELSALDAEKLVFLPLGIHVNHLQRARQVRRVAIVLELHPCRPVLVWLGIDDHTSQPDVEAVCLGAFLSAVLILGHAVTRNLEHLQPVWHLSVYCDGHAEGKASHQKSFSHLMIWYKFMFFCLRRSFSLFAKVINIAQLRLNAT